MPNYMLLLHEQPSDFSQYSAEAAEVIGGYFAVSADSYDDAVKLAAECPHLKYGGRIELREIEPTG